MNGIYYVPDIQVLLLSRLLLLPLRGLRIPGGAWHNCYIIADAAAAAATHLDIGFSRRGARRRGGGRRRLCGSRGAHTRQQLLHQAVGAAGARRGRRRFRGTGFQGGGGGHFGPVIGSRTQDFGAQDFGAQNLGAHLHLTISSYTTSCDLRGRVQDNGPIPLTRRTMLHHSSSASGVKW